MGAWLDGTKRADRDVEVAGPLDATQPRTALVLGGTVLNSENLAGKVDNYFGKMGKFFAGWVFALTFGYTPEG
jgi:hypothetical protein